MLKKNHKPYDMSYISEGLSTFYQLRDKTQIQLDAYVKKLTDIFSIENISQQLISKDKKIFARLFKMMNQLKVITTFIIYMPFFFFQKRRIDNLREKSSFSSVIISIASNRLQDKKNIFHPREYFYSLTKDFSAHPNRSLVDNEIINADYLFICDPLLKSPLWKQYKLCSKQNVFIIDTNFLIFISLMNFLSKNYFYNLLAKNNKPGLKTLKSRIASHIFTEGYYHTLKYSTNIKAFFLTSNSFVTEILRLYLIQSLACISLCEIMHGVPTVFYERYLADILAIGEKYQYQAYQKHSSIPQIPMLPMFGILKRDVKCNEMTAINPYLNRYIIERQKNYKTTEDFVKSELKVLCLQEKPGDHFIIISFIGAMSLDKDHFSSDIFKIECYILFLIKKILLEIKCNYKIIYTPHPGHSFEQFKECLFFKVHNILLYPDTIFTWFSADISFALFSGALFEAAYFGVQAFMPTIPEDELYPKELLQLLTYPTNKMQNLYADLLFFITSAIEKATEPLFSKIISRISRFEHPNLAVDKSLEIKLGEQYD